MMTRRETVIVTAAVFPGVVLLGVLSQALIIGPGPADVAPAPPAPVMVHPIPAYTVPSPAGTVRAVIPA